jgi:hypothetical protein
LALALLSLFLFLRSFAFSGVEFKYWYDGLAFALALIVASALTVFNRRWSQLVAALLTLPMVLWFCYVALKVHAMLPSSSAEQTFLRDAESWRQFLWNHPEVLLQYVVAFIIFIVGSVGFVRSLRSKRLVLETGG